MAGVHISQSCLSQSLRHPSRSARRHRGISLILLTGLCWFLTASLPRAASAQTATVTKVHDFGSGSEGFFPTGPLIIGADGVSIVGATAGGGANNQGTIFSYTPPAGGGGTVSTGTYTTLYSFSPFTKGTNQNADGTDPAGGVILGTDGNYYGCAANGGANGDGVVFKLTPGGTFTDLHDFSGTDGTQPMGLVQASATTFYGTTMSGVDKSASGGTNALGGTVFKMELPATGKATVTTLYDFTALATGGSTSTDGSNPNAAPTLDASGNVFGTAQRGGNGAGGLGTNGIDGGTIWEISSAGAFKSPNFYEFTAVSSSGTNADGSYPSSALTLTPDGSFIGTAQLGGNNSGTVFRITQDGKLTPLHLFAAYSGGANNSNADGDEPYGGVIQLTNGSIYGTTRIGGMNGDGVFFSITSAGTFTDLHDFVGSDGKAPQCTLVEGKDGNLYGTTTTGGSNNPTLSDGSPSGGGGTLFAYAVNSGGPFITTLSPATVQTGAGAVTLTVTGTAFTSTSVVDWQTTPGVTPTTALTPLATTFVSATQLTAIIPANLLASDAVLKGGTTETHNVTVVTAAGTSPAVSFAVAPLGPPTITAISPTSLEAGAGAATLTITGTGFAAGDTVTFQGTTLTPASVTAATITVVIPAALTAVSATAAVTVVSSTEGSSNAVSVPISPVTTFAPGLQFISLPYAYPGVTLASLFGYANPKLAVWNPAANVYAVTPNAPADATRLGRGYWVRFPAAANVTGAGVPATLGTAFSLGLLKGWNMIGDPFTTTTPGTGMTVVDSTGLAYTYSDATSAGIINGTTYSYDPGSNAYISETTGDMKPFAGYWIYANAPCTLLMNGS